MNQESVLRDLLALLSRLRLEYMLTGSYASNIYGRVRSTFDADIVIALLDAEAVQLLESLGRDFYVDVATAAEIREAGSQFNSLHQASGLKVDFYLARTEQDRTALRRRRSVRIWEMDVSVIAPEDLILAKLSWARDGGSARQIEDARGVYELQKDTLDRRYLESKASDLGLQDILGQIAR